MVPNLCIQGATVSDHGYLDRQSKLIELGLQYTGSQWVDGDPAAAVAGAGAGAIHNLQGQLLIDHGYNVQTARTE